MSEKVRKNYNLKKETQADREKAQEDRNEAEELLEIAVERLKSANEEEDRVLMKKEWYEEKFEQKFNTQYVVSEKKEKKTLATQDVAD